MSADTFIGIGEFPDGYRITHVDQAPDNLIHYKTEPITELQKRVKEYFGESPLYKTKREAMNVLLYRKEAFEENNYSCYGLEHGILEFKFNFII